MPIGQGMLLACGAETPLLDKICAALPDWQIEKTTGFTFSACVERKAHTLLLVEPLPRVGAPPSDTDGALLDQLVRAAEAPSVKRVFVVTSRVDTDAGLRRLRRSGARYVIVRPPLLVPDELKGKRVLVPKEKTHLPLVTLDDLAKAIVETLRDSAVMGQTIDVPPSGLAALEAIGAKPRVVPPWRATLGRWLKQPVLDGPPMQANASIA